MTIMRTTVKVTGRNLNDIFKLPCVKAIHKIADGKIAVELYDTQVTAYAGDVICLADNGETTIKRAAGR